jgi:predicted alpha/beta-hydrolase family hydrolase
MPEPSRIHIRVSETQLVSALLLEPPHMRAGFVFAHGAGAGMSHTFMEAVASGLCDRGIGTLRYQFPYVERGSRRPDPPAVAQATVRAAVGEALRQWPKLPLIAGGKSFGARMTSMAQAAGALPGVRGLAFLGFPLHPAGQPSTQRALHLERLACPMLFLQGTRDELADPGLLSEVVQSLAAHATLRLLQDADHGFHVLVRSGRTDAQVLDELLDALVGWADALISV